MGELTSIVPALLAAIASLAGVIAFLYAQTRADAKAIFERLAKCEQDRDDLWVEIAGLKKRERERERLP